jgi:hypothetical protein
MSTMAEVLEAPLGARAGSVRRSAAQLGKARARLVEAELAEVRADVRRVDDGMEGVGVVSIARAAELLGTTPAGIHRLRCRGELLMVQARGRAAVPKSEVRRVATGVDPDARRARARP